MGAGTPVIASDLPVVRELIAHREDGYLVTPDRPAELARAIRVLLDYPDVIQRLGQRAQDKIRERFLWRHSNDKLSHILHTLTAEPEP